MNKSHVELYEAPGVTALVFLCASMMTLAGTILNTAAVMKHGESSIWYSYIWLASFITGARFFFTSSRGYLRQRRPGSSLLRALDFCARHYTLLVIIQTGAILLTLAVSELLWEGDVRSFYMRARIALFVAGILALVPAIIETLTTPSYIAILDESRAARPHTSRRGDGTGSNGARPRNVTR